MTRLGARGVAYLHLARVSNLPTVWTNVLAALTVAEASGGWPLLAASASLFYTGGMVLNDAFDAEVDRRVRPGRPIPSGAVRRSEAFVLGGSLLFLGEALLGMSRHPGTALAWGLLLGIAIVFYDYRHKGIAHGPVVMGLCRALVYLVAAAAAAHITPAVTLAAAVMWIYVIGLTWVAKQAGTRAGALVPWLLAGISLVDAAAIVVAGRSDLAVVAAAGFALTLVLQRVVPGH